MLFRYALKELRAYPRYTALFIVNILIGLVGLATIESFNASIANEVQASSKATAGGDLIISSRLPIAPEIVDSVKSEIKGSFEMGEAEEVLTMASTSTSSRLIQLRAQSDDLPFYGEIQTRPKLPFSDLSESPSLWAYPELLVQLDLKVGDTLKIGGLDFKITSEVIKDSAPQTGRGAFAPRVYVSRASLEKTGLIQKGSTVFHQKVFKLSSDSDADQIAKAVAAKVKDSTINIRSHTQSSEASARMMSYLNDYLGLISLIALLLSNIGVIYLFRAHLVDRLKDMSILKMIGMRANNIIKLYAIEVMILAIAGVALAAGVASVLLPVVSLMTADLLPISLNLKPEFSALLLVGAVGITTTLLCVYPLLSRVKQFSPNELFQESFTSKFSPNAKSAVAWLPALLFFYGLAIWQANSIKVASIFVAALLGAAVLIFLIGYGFLKLGDSRASTRSFEFHFALRELVRRPFESLTTFVALAVGALLASLVFTVEASIKTEFDFGTQGSQPSLFMFDIQEEQIAGLTDLTKQLEAPFSNVSSMVRARLISINGSTDFNTQQEESFQTRESEEAARSRNRAFNLTERGTLSTSETLVEGRSFSGVFDASSGKLPEISLEERFAERLGSGLGDKLTFDIMGVELTGEVVSIRRVEWASFQPNFFIQFQEGVLTDTPKVFLASTVNLNTDKKNELQRKVVAAFPNVSVIDVSEAVKQLMNTTSKMAFALKIMAFLVLFASIFVALSIQTYHLQRTAQQRSLLKLIGLVRRRIERIEILETWLLTFSSLIFGWIVSYLVAWPVTYLMFARTPVVTPQSLIVFVVLIPIAFRSLRHYGAGSSPK